MVLMVAQQVTGIQNRFSKCNFQKYFCLILKGPEHLYLVYNISQRSSTKLVRILPMGLKDTPPRVSQNFNIKLYQENIKRFLLLSHSNRNLTKLNRNDPLVVPYKNYSNTCSSDWLHKYVKGSKLGFQNAFFFQNIFVCNYTAQRCRHITQSRGPLPKVFKLCPWVIFERSQRSQFYIQIYCEKLVQHG